MVVSHREPLWLNLRKKPWPHVVLRWMHNSAVLSAAAGANSARFGTVSGLGLSARWSEIRGLLASLETQSEKPVSTEEKGSCGTSVSATRSIPEQEP